MWSDYIYCDNDIIPVLTSGISSVPHYSLSVLLYLPCNITLSLFYERGYCPFLLKYHLVLLYIF